MYKVGYVVKYKGPGRIRDHLKIITLGNDGKFTAIVVAPSSYSMGQILALFYDDKDSALTIIKSASNYPNKYKITRRKKHDRSSVSNK